MTSISERVLTRIDRPIRSLVEAMNSIPFIETLSSCAGHPERHKSMNATQYAQAIVDFRIINEDKWGLTWIALLNQLLLQQERNKEGQAVTAYRWYRVCNGKFMWEWELRISVCERSSQACRDMLNREFFWLTDFFQSIELTLPDICHTDHSLRKGLVLRCRDQR